MNVYSYHTHTHIYIYINLSRCFWMILYIWRERTKYHAGRHEPFAASSRAVISSLRPLSLQKTVGCRSLPMQRPESHPDVTRLCKIRQKSDRRTALSLSMDEVVTSRFNVRSQVEATRPYKKNGTGCSVLPGVSFTPLLSWRNAMGIVDHFRELEVSRTCA